MNAPARHVGGYNDDIGGDIDSFTMLDADPPHVAIAGNYEPRSSNPRGRRLFLDLLIADKVYR